MENLKQKAQAAAEAIYPKYYSMIKALQNPPDFVYHVLRILMFLSDDVPLG